MGEGCDGAEEDAEDHIGDGKRGEERGQGLAERNSSRRMGVVRTGSRVPCSRSPTTE